MKKKIITKKISSLEFNELRDYMQNCIKESITCQSFDVKNILDYTEWQMEDYFAPGFPELYDETSDEYLGVGLDTIYDLYILNDDTRADFESAFEQARDAAIEERISELVEEVEEYDSEEEVKVIEIDDSLTEEEQRTLKEQDEYIESAGDEAEVTFTPSMFIANRINEEIEKLKNCGYKQLAVDSDENYDFYINGDLCDRLVEEGCSVEQVAKWLGASVVVVYQGTDDFDYEKSWFKRSKIHCNLDIRALYEEAEGQAWEGWFCPVWASIDEENGCVDVSLGAAVSKNTSFLNDDGEVPASWVGSIPCWFRKYGKDDAECWAEDTGCQAEDFDSDEEMHNEVDSWDLTEETKEVENSIKEYAKSKGFDVEFE